MYDNKENQTFDLTVSIEHDCNKNPSHFTLVGRPTDNFMNQKALRIDPSQFILHLYLMVGKVYIDNNC